jgi:uncharacterized protein (TIGR02453 family)
MIKKSTLVFLRHLSSNNDRDWFNAHRDRYEEAKDNVEQFCDALIQRMNVHDQIETPSGKKALFRIYNDVRFSKNKDPYNPRFAGYLNRLKPMLRGGYYFWIKPGGSKIGCGFSYPDPEDLKRIRMDIARNYEDWEVLLNSKAIRSNFGTIVERGLVKSAPRGFQKDHPAIDLLRHKQYWFDHSFSDEEVLSRDYLNKMNKTFKSIRPFFDYMSDVLSTDLNGELITQK